MAVRTLAALLLVIISANSARADSDGYYCIGPGYLAYQFGFAAPSDLPPRLYVLHLAGRGEAAVLDLPQFQVHGMHCGERQVQLAAFDAVYTVALDAENRPTGFSQRPLDEAGRFPAELRAPQQNLGAWSKPVGTLKTERTLLGKTPNGTDVVLEIRPRAGREPCVTEITTRVIEIDAAGLVLRERLVFEGRGHRECGGPPDMPL